MRAPRAKGMPKGGRAPKQRKKVLHGFKKACPQQVFAFEVPYDHSVPSIFSVDLLPQMDTDGAVSDRTWRFIGTWLRLGRGMQDAVGCSRMQ